jgi:hypothetical protein
MITKLFTAVTKARQPKKPTRAVPALQRSKHVLVCGVVPCHQHEFRVCNNSKINWVEYNLKHRKKSDN